MSITWNPSDIGANLTLSNNNLTVEKTSGGWTAVRSTEFKAQGKWYWEITIDVAASADTMIGIGTSSELLTYPGDTVEGYGYYGTGGQKYHSGPAAYGAAYTANDVIGVALDMDNGKIWWSKNGVWQASGNPATGINEAYSSIVGNFYTMVGLYTSGNKVTANFGTTSFVYSPPSGFFPLGLSGYFEGYVYEEGSPVERILYLYDRSDGSLIASTTSSGNGYYYLATTSSGSHYIVCLDDVAAPSYNDLILGNIYPTISG